MIGFSEKLKVIFLSWVVKIKTVGKFRHKKCVNSLRTKGFTHQKYLPHKY